MSTTRSKSDSISTANTDNDVDHDNDLSTLTELSTNTIDNIDIDDELEEMKRRVAEMEEEAKLNTASNDTNNNNTSTSTISAEQRDIDNRSVYVGQVEYSSTVEELTALFSACGTVNRVTIITDKYSGHSKGYAYIEFKEQSSIENALLLNDTEFKGRQIKVTAKRTNIPKHQLYGSNTPSRGSGYRGSRGRAGYRGGYRGGFRGRGGYRGRGRGAAYPY